MQIEYSKVAEEIFKAVRKEKEKFRRGEITVKELQARAKSLHDVLAMVRFRAENGT